MNGFGGLSSSFLFDSHIDNSSNSNSTSSLSPSGSPPLASLLGGGSAESIARPSWLFTSQSVYANQSTPTEALSSLLDTFSSPVSTTNSPLSSLNNRTTNSSSPFKQMTNRVSVSARRSLGGGASDPLNPLGAPGMPVNGTGGMQQQQPANTGANAQAANQSPKNPKLYKTELCRSWMEHGRCNYGERCQYAHGENEKRQIPRHPKYKTEACQSFHQNGYCPYGPRCHFIHNEAEHLAALSSMPSSLNIFSSTTSTPTRPTGTGNSSISSGALSAAQQQSSLFRMSSLPNYGSAGESPAGSSDSGSESPNGSFSPGLDIDDNGPFTIGFMTPQAPSRRATQRYHSMYDQKSNEPISDLLNDFLTFKFEESTGRLPVFAQLSANQ